MNKPKTSLDGTRYMLKLTQEWESQLIASIENLKTATELEVKLAWGTRKTNPDQLPFRVTVTKGSTYIWVDSDGKEYTLDGIVVTTPDGHKETVTFDREFNKRWYAAERELKSAREQIAFLNQKIAEYKGN